MSPRKVLNLVRRLPSQSHTVTAIRNSLTPEQLAEAQKTGDPSRARWSDEGMLIAAVKDELAFLRHQHLVANGAKNVKDPEPMVRPGVNRSQAKGITTAQAKYLNDLRETHRANQERARAEAPEAHTDDETEAP